MMQALNNLLLGSGKLLIPLLAILILPMMSVHAQSPLLAFNTKKEATVDVPINSTSDNRIINGQATTTTDPDIDIAELEFALIPLTKDEVQIEVYGWLSLVKDKATELSKAEIVVNQRKKHINAAEEISTITANNAELIKQSKTDDIAAAQLKEEIKELAEISTELPSETKRKITDLNDNELIQLSDKAKDYSEELEERRDDLINNLSELRSQKNLLLDRFSITLEQWEAKGGDAKELKLYASVLSDINVDLTDSSAVWLTIINWLKDTNGGLLWLANLIKFMVSLLFIYITSAVVGRITDAALNHNKRLTILLKKFIQVSIRRTILVIGFIMSLTLIEIDVGPILALIGAAGLVVAFALQSTLSNFASGMLILIYRPFDVGDMIDLEGTTGSVHSMTLLSTTIKTFDNQHLIVPNNSIWNSTIINVTGSKTRRVDMVFGIGYQDDMNKAENIMREILEQHTLVLDTPKPVIKVDQLGDSSVNFVCRPWVRTENYLDVYWDVTRQVKEAFDEQGVSIPFPQRDVHIHQKS